MHVRTDRLSLPVAGLAAFLAGTLAGCGPSAGAAIAGTASTSAAPTGSNNPLAAVKLAAQAANGMSSFTGTMSLKIVSRPGTVASSASASVGTGTGTGTGDVTMSATFAERVRPTLLADVIIRSLSSAGKSLPGGVSEVVTPGTIYLKWSLLTQTLHLSRPWLMIPVSVMSKNSGINVGLLFSEASSSGPLTEAQLLAGATSVRQVGTGTFRDVPVTEYTGTISLDKGIGFLSGSAKTQLQQAVAAEGFSNATFTAWIDARHTVRKAIVTEVGKTVTETTITTITGAGKPVNVAAPPPSQTAPMPASELG